MEHVVGIKNPRVAIVNNGAEEEKGNALVKETFRFSKKQKGSILLEALRHEIFRQVMRMLSYAKLLSEMLFSNFMRESVLN